MADINSRLGDLKEDAWQLAALCRDEGDTEAFRVLVDFSERITNLFRGRERPTAGKNTASSGLIDIFSHDGRHPAKLDLRRWTGQGSKCILMGGDWFSLSKAAASITGYQTRGPEWWKYKEGGELRPVSELKK